ncbi:hypothetical protein [Nonomuraea dietziae]|uniref:hypothetical protein n=1 Tax=Nonomuraea dietziae TaxID=65515 RepID=UPI0031DB44D5
MLHRDPLTIAVAQPPTMAFDVAANARTTLRRRPRGRRARGGLPELSLTGYELDAPAITLRGPASHPDRRGVCRDGIGRPGGRPRAGRAGPPVHRDAGRESASGVLVAYRKMCLGGQESERFQPGEKPSVL